MSLDIYVNVTVSDINCIINDIDILFMKACENIFGHVQPNNNIIDKRKKPWFSAERPVARNIYHKIHIFYIVISLSLAALYLVRLCVTSQTWALIF